MPVHINIAVSEPLTQEMDMPSVRERFVTRIPSSNIPDEHSMKLLCDEFMSARKVLVLVAFSQPDEQLSQGSFTFSGIAAGCRSYRKHSQCEGEEFDTYDR